jgi:hypothetical protein
VLVRALLIIRQCWIKAQPTIGMPTILVVAYKNHAIDEFLVDLHRAMQTQRGPAALRMVRIGGGCKEPGMLRCFGFGFGFGFGIGFCFGFCFCF